MDPALLAFLTAHTLSPEVHKTFRLLVNKVSDATGAGAAPLLKIADAMVSKYVSRSAAERAQQTALIEDETKELLAARARQREIEAVRIDPEMNESENDEARRVLQRLLKAETLKQRNFDKILLGAVPHLSPDAQPAQMDDDWIQNFFEDASKVSNEQMQRLWSKLLAGEAQAVGSFSRRTLKTLSMMGGADAAMFSKLCCFCLGDANNLIPFIYRRHAPSAPYQKNGFDLSALVELEALGLIKVNSLESLAVPVSSNTLRISYFRHEMGVSLNSKSEPNRLRIGSVTFAESGTQLSKIADRSLINGMLDHIAETWSAVGYEVKILN